MNKKNIITIIVVTLVLLAAAVLITGCKGRDKDTIKIGAILPLTGNYADYGVSPQQGMIIAAEEINSAGGINGRKIELLFEDSQGKPENALSAYQKLSSTNQVKYFVTSLTGPSIAIKDKLKDTEAAQIIFAMTESITYGTDNVIRVYPGMIEEGKVLLEAIKKLKPSRIAMLNLKHEAFSQQIDSILKPGFSSSNVKLVSHEEYDADNLTSLPELLQRIKRTKPEVLYISGHANFMLPMVKAIRESGILTTTKVISGMNLPIAVSNGSVPISSVEGFYVACPSFYADVHKSDHNSGLMQFAKAVKDRFNSDLSLDSVAGYMAVQVLAGGLRKDSVNPLKTVQSIKDIKSFSHIDTKVEVKADGDCVWPWGIVQYQNEELVKVQ
jgi:branched-chain amino acid transport system substrate-binding protein